MCDISMCLNKSCPSRNSCVRFMAVPNELRQSYASFEWRMDDGKCSSYWPLVDSPYLLVEK